MSYEWIETRDNLAWRKAKGESLTPEEEQLLKELDSRLDALEEPAPGLSPEVMKIIEEVLQRRPQVRDLRPEWKGVVCTVWGCDNPATCETALEGLPWEPSCASCLRR